MYRKQIFQKVAPSLPSTPISKEIASIPSYGSLSSVVQRVQQDPNSVSGDERQELESAIGSRSTREILAGKQSPWVPQFQGISAQLWGDSGQVGAPIQAKLTIGEAGDKYEQEADRVAKDVVQRINTPQTNAMPKEDSAQIQTNTLQRQQTDKEELQLKQLPQMVQRREAIAGGEASTDLANSINSARGAGQSLDASLQQSMGQAMGTDFSGVRVHTDAQADQLNQSIQAKAFTTGQNVFFRQGEYQPGSRGGQELIAHELTHVVQQNGGAVQRSHQPEALLQHQLATETPTQCITSVPSPYIQRLMSVDTFKTATSYLVHYYVQFWKSPTKERINPKNILETIDVLLGNCHQAKEEYGVSVQYSTSLQRLLDYLTNEAEAAKMNIGMMQMMGETIPQYAKTYNDEINRLTQDVTNEKRLVDEEVIGEFKPFGEASEEERNTRMTFAKAKYTQVVHLLEDIPLLDDTEALKKLLNNFYARTDYTYKFGGGGSLFTSSGNCWSLCNEFQILAKEALGIGVESPGYTLSNVRVKYPRKIIGADIVGDVDGGENGWMWENHAVVNWKGTIIDVLYGVWGSTGVEITHVGKEPNDYWTSHEETIYRSKPEVAKNQWKDKYTLDSSKASFVPD
ncbi:DUF4157 domain-containing protein [Nostoc punctiforme UO1]|uniref:eCIS core domain-containing protein n=1 Tax=Nostoc punctiforme TaxID=272131 RepID=UPI0030AE209C